MYQSGLLFPTLKVMLRSSGPALQMAAGSFGPFMNTIRVTVAETLKQASERLETSPTRNEEPVEMSSVSPFRSSLSAQSTPSKKKN